MSARKAFSIRSKEYRKALDILIDDKPLTKAQLRSLPAYATGQEHIRQGSGCCAPPKGFVGDRAAAYKLGWLEEAKRRGNRVRIGYREI